MSKTEFKVQGKEMTKAVNALVDKARELDLSVFEFEMAMEIACAMLDKEVKGAVNVKDLDIRAESYE